jgi:hypothetical protein
VIAVMPSRVLLLTLLLSVFVLPVFSYAQKENLPTKLPQKTAKTKRAGLDTQKVIRLNYGLPDWNKDSTQIDSASIMLREGNTGRVVQINLEETAPDSSQFSGLYSVQWEKITEMAPEFYVPPQELLNTPQGSKKLTQLVQNNQLKKAPFIIRRGKNGEQIVELFDTAEQAREAMKAFREERAALEMQSKKIVNESAIEAARIAAEAKIKEEAAKAAAERSRMAQIEARKASEQAAAMEKQNAAEQARRRQLAQKFANEAIELYKAGKFKEAAAKFEQAVEQDPTNKTYYYQFGVTLYRIDNYNKSLVYLNLSEGSYKNPTEKEIYRGHNLYKM